MLAPTAAAAGYPDARPYDLRHNDVSLLSEEGRSIIEIARQTGHSPNLTLINTDGHVFQEATEAEKVGAEDEIRAARVVTRMWTQPVQERCEPLRPSVLATPTSPMGQRNATSRNGRLSLEPEW